MNNSITKEFRFGSLIRFALPTIIMMIFMSLYGIVDAIFVSRFIGTDALSAINIVYPAINLVMAIAIMLSTGGSAVVARKLGEGKTKQAYENYTLIVITGVIAGLVIGIIGILFLEPICNILGASPLLMDYCKDYLFVIMLFAPAMVLQLLFQTFFVAAGQPNLGLALTILAGITNGILDYVFIVPMDLGITGAALATATGYMIPAIVGLIYFFKKKNSLHFVAFKVDWSVLKESCFNGSSEMVTNVSTGIITFLFNILMMRYLGENGVAAITIVLYAQFLLTALYLGFSMGVAPIISYNHGNKNIQQLKSIFKSSMIFITISSAVVFIFSLGLAENLVSIFSPVGTPVYDIATEGFLLFSSSFLFTGINIYASSMFTAFSNGRVSAIISFMRTFVFIMLGLLLLPKVLEINGLWLAVPIAEFMTLVLSVILINKFRQQYHYA